MPDIDRCELLSSTRQQFAEHPLLRWRKRDDVIIADLDLRPATWYLRDGDRPGRIELRSRHEHTTLDAQYQKVVHQDGQAIIDNTGLQPREFDQGLASDDLLLAVQFPNCVEYNLGR